MNAIMIATITVKNPENFRDYLTKVQTVAAPYGAEMMFRGNANEVLTGENGDHQIVVIVKFPSVNAINQWYDSDEYQALIPIREKGAEMKITTYSPIAPT